MIGGIVILIVTIVVAGILSSFERFQAKYFFDENINIVQFYNGLLVPVGVFSAYTLILNNVLSRPAKILVNVSDQVFVFASVLLITLISVGVGTHTPSKILNKLFEDDAKHTKIYKTNEFYHLQFSHFLIYANSLILAFVGALAEINHPDLTGANGPGVVIIGALVGIAVGIAIAVYHVNMGLGMRRYMVLSSILVALLMGIMGWLELQLAVHPIYLFWLVGLLFAAITIALFKLLFVLNVIKPNPRL
ncbi:MAG: hypothetical protein ABIG95_04195 [Candidatus Woesearchaeota archaeon]